MSLFPSLTMLTMTLTYDAGPTRDLAGEAYVWFQALRRGSNHDHAAMALASVHPHAFGDASDQFI